MTKLLVAGIALTLSCAAFAADPVGQEVTDANVRGTIMGALFYKLPRAPYNNTNLAIGLGKFLGQNPGSGFHLRCLAKDPGHGGNISLLCDLIAGYGQSPAFKISFKGKMDATGAEAEVDARSIVHEIEP